MIAGLQPLSSSNIDRHTVPDGYTAQDIRNKLAGESNMILDRKRKKENELPLGWNNGGVNLHFGGFDGYLVSIT